MRRQGFLLIDILIALAIMSICSLTLVMTQVHLSQCHREARCYMQAVSLGRTFIEKMQSEGKLPRQERLVKGTFTITWQDRSHTLSHWQETKGFAAVRVKVSWPVSPESEKSVILDTGVLIA